MIQFPKHEGFTLPSVQSVHILRDPPKSIHTRKKERINQGDVNHLLRSGVDRYSENIQHFARGVNPMVSVSYSNHGGGNGSKLSTKKNVANAHNAYKVAKDGAFRPPIFRQEDLLPLSRLKRKNTSIDGIPGSNLTYIRNIEEVSLSKEPIRAAVHPTVVYLAGASQHPYDTNPVLDPKLYVEGVTTPMKGYTSYTPKCDEKEINKGIIIRPSIKVSTSKGVKTSLSVANLDSSTVTREIKEDPLRSYLGPTYKIAMYNSQTHDLAELKLPDNIKEQITVATNVNKPILLPSSRMEGSQPIKLKDYHWTIHQTAKGAPNVLIIEPTRPDVCLTRNSPLYNAVTNVRSTLGTTLQNVNAPILNNNRPIVSAFGTPNAPNVIDNLTRAAELPESIKKGSFANFGIEPSYYVKRNVNPTYFKKSSDKKSSLRESLRDNVPLNFSRDN